MSSYGWELLGRGPWWKTWTGPWKPNVFTTSSWYNLTLQKWDYEIEVPDGTGAVHIQFGGPTKFSNLTAGYRYAIVLQYYWDRTANYDAATAYSWESNAC